VAASRGSVVLDLLLPRVEPGEIDIHFDLDHTMVKLLVPDDAKHRCRVARFAALRQELRVRTPLTLRGFILGATFWVVIGVGSATTLVLATPRTASATAVGPPRQALSRVCVRPSAPRRGSAACPAAIRAQTGAANAVTETSAKLAGIVIRTGATQYYFAFGATRAYRRRTRWTRVRPGKGRARASASLAGLSPATSYQYRLVAAACARCRAADGANRSFTTAPAPLPPAAQTGMASAVAQSTATLSGSVNPDGTATSYYFEYGVTAVYGSETGTQRAGSEKRSAAAVTALSGLGALVTYHYRLVAASRGGTTYGADATFTTTGYYQNPVYSAAAFPDPFILDNGGTHSDYWAFGTGDLFPILHSTDLVKWAAEGTAMMTRPAWVIASGDWHPWAPSVVQSQQPCPGTASSACYIMYYVGLSAQLNTNCIGVATSPTPGGPYSDHGPLGLGGSASDSGPTATVPGTPIGCGDQGGEGNIDPSPFIDLSGQPYLYVSTDHSCTGSACVVAPTISVIPLASGLLEASGPRVALLPGVAGTWEAAGVQTPTVEGPFMELHDGTYYLFYSGGSYEAAYGMGYATATSPVGPFTRSPSNPILSETSTVFSPGGGDGVVTGPRGGLWMLYAARQPSYAAARTLSLDPFSWQPASSPGSPEVPVMAGPTSTPQSTQP
jgi:hypothetical protein